MRLRWLEERDVPQLFSIFSNREITRFWSWPAYEEVDQAAELLEEIQALFEKRTLFQWGVARSEDDRVIGTCTLARIDASNARAEIGFALHRDFWGRGLMREATTALVDFSFDILRLRRLEADVDPHNERSIRLLEDLGFAREGLLRERWFVDGEVQDSLLLGLLAREWRSRDVLAEED